MAAEGQKRRKTKATFTFVSPWKGGARAVTHATRQCGWISHPCCVGARTDRQTPRAGASRRKPPHWSTFSHGPAVGRDRIRSDRGVRVLETATHMHFFCLLDIFFPFSSIFFFCFSREGD